MRVHFCLNPQPLIPGLQKALWMLTQNRWCRWLKPDKSTALKPPKVHSTSYFSVLPLSN